MTFTLRRRFLLAIVALTLLVGGYLASSGAPARVDMAELAIQIPFLLAGVWVLWSAVLAGHWRWLGLAIVVGLAALGRTLLLGQTVSKLDPFPLDVAVGSFVVLSIEVLVFLGSIWALDSLIQRFCGHRGATSRDGR